MEFYVPFATSNRPSPQSTDFAPAKSEGRSVCDCRTAGMVCAQNLTQEDPQRNQRRIDPVDPVLADRCRRLRDELLREDIAERQILRPGETDALGISPVAERSLVRTPHRCGLLAGDRPVPQNHLRKRGPFCICHLQLRLYEILRAIRLHVRSATGEPQRTRAPRPAHQQLPLFEGLGRRHDRLPRELPSHTRLPPLLG